MMTPTVSTSADPTPIELIFAKKIRDALENASYLSEAKKCQGVFGLQVKNDPQAITVEIDGLNINIKSGIAKSCQVVITTDLKPNSKPDVKGLLRHPMFAMQVGKFLDFPSASWADALKRFWDQHQEVKGMPTGLTIKCLDEDRQLSVGNTEDACYFEGTAANLAEAFTGGSPFIQLLAQGSLRGRYNVQQAIVLSDITLHMMLGEA